MEQLQPGDILLRGYDKYLSGVFIPGYFSHAGMYLGEVSEADSAFCAPEFVAGDATGFFRPGKKMVVHALAKGVFMEDIIDFCRCDRLMVVRLPAEFQQKARIDKVDANDDTFSVAEYDLFRDLRAGETLRFDEVFPVIRRAALAQIGKPYDFKFNFDNLNW